MSDRMVRMVEHEYERAFASWEHTPRWSFLARWWRKRQWRRWLGALSAEVKRAWHLPSIKGDADER